MSFEGLIATPFGYLLDGLYRLTGNYGLALVIFAVLVQLVMVPVAIRNQRNATLKRHLKPIERKLQEQYKDDPEKQAEEIAAIYDNAKVSLLGSFLLSILPIFILVPIFQAVAQPITYLFHEAPETAAAIVKVIREEAPELFVSGYNQVTAITHIQDFAEIVKDKVPEVSARTLEGLDYSFLGLNLGSVPGVHIIGKADWVWDWAHIGVVLIPIVYMARRIYETVYGIYITFSNYFKEKKKAKANDEPLPKLPNPPLFPILFLFMSLTAMFAVPIAMNLYWLTSGIAASALNKLIGKKLKERLAPPVVLAEDKDIQLQQEV